MSYFVLSPSKYIFCLSPLKDRFNCSSTCMQKMKKFCSSKVIMNQNSRLVDCCGFLETVYSKMSIQAHT